MARNQLIQFRRDTADNWSSVDPTPAAGEPCYDSDNGILKIGDGSTPYSRLPPVAPGKDIMPVGIEWDTSSSSPTLTQIDINGNTITPSTSFFDNHAIWGNIWRCVVDPSTGEVTYGSNPRGDGLDLTGVSGNVMVEIPKFYVKFESSGDIRKWWVSPKLPSPDAGFEVHPMFRMRGGTIRPKIYVSAYEAAGFDDSGTFKLKSATNLQPVTGEVGYPDLPNAGHFDIDEAEEYAGNIGSGYGCWNIWTYAGIRLLFYTEMGSLDSQSVAGRGIVDKASGTDFAGELTGADGIDSNIGTNGTGVGTGSDGYTPIAYRGLENLWGNVWQFCIGYNAVDAEHRITPRNGTGVLAGDLAAGEYESSIVAPITADGYQSDVETENLLQYLMIPSEVIGSSSTYLSDFFYAHDIGEQNVMLSGGDWLSRSTAGVGYLASNRGSSNSHRTIGARFEFIP